MPNLDDVVHLPVLTGEGLGEEDDDQVIERSSLLDSVTSFTGQASPMEFLGTHSSALFHSK